MCYRPGDDWGFFVLSWLGSEEEPKIRRSHVVDSVAKYDTFCDCFIALFGRFKFEASYRASFAIFVKLVLSLSPGMPRALPICVRARTQPFRPKINFRSRSTTLLQDSPTHRPVPISNTREHNAHSSGSKLWESHRRAKPRVFRTTCQLPRPLRANRVIRLRQPPRVSSQISLNNPHNGTRRTIKRTRARETSISHARKSIQNRVSLPLSSLSNKMKLLPLAIPFRIPVLLK